MSPHGSKSRHFTTDGTEWGELQFSGVLVVIVITRHCGRLLDAFITAATATLHKRPAERFAETEQENWGNAGLKEQKELTNEMEEVHSLSRDPCRHVGSHDVANVFRNNAKSI